VRITIVDEGASRTASWWDLHRLDWSKFGLVLGAGGVTGMAFEAGVLLGLGIDHGVDPTAATDLVGTSAGSIVAALVALGLDSADLAAVIAGVPRHFSERAMHINPFFVDGSIPTLPGLGRLIRWQRPRDVVVLTQLAAHRHYRAALLRVLRDGDYDMSGHIAFFQGQAWPAARRLRLCVTDSANGSRVVLDEADATDLHDAVLASCAVPGVMRSVRIGERCFVDGGVVSPTSADLLARRLDGEGTAPDLVVVISPMSGTATRSLQGALGTRYATRRLRRELALFGPDQTVVVIEPVGALSRLVVDDSLGGGSATKILQTAFTLASA